MTIQEIAETLVEEFEFLDDWMDKYTHIIEMARELEPLPESEKTEDNIVRGCQSQVWLVAGNEDGKVVFKADSDAVITKGLIAMLVRVLSNHSPSEIINADLTFLDTIGVREHLSPNRSNGLSAMMKQMKYYAMALKAQQEMG